MSMPSKMPATRPSTISGWSRAKSARNGVDVGDELVGVAGAGEDPRAGDALGDVVDVRRPGDAGVDVLSATNAAAASKAVAVYLVLTSAGLSPAESSSEVR